MLTNLVLLAATVGPLSLTDAPSRDGAAFDRPRVEVWTNRGDDPYQTGQRARVFLRADRDAYVTVFRVDTDGRVRVLFPHDPWEDNFVRGGRDFEVTGGHGGDAFDIDDYPGVGYLFAVSAPDPYQYDAITAGDHWDYRVIANGRVRGDPYVGLTDLAGQMLPPGYDDWDYDIVPYYVQRHYDYPRFLCYDCHRYASYSFWDPYAYSCVRFRIVVYDDPYYYPYRYYGGRRVVFTRPFRPEPRFIFKDRGGVGDDRFVTRERQRPVNDNGRRGVRGADLGGRGSIPVPDVKPRRGDGRPDDPSRRPDRRQQPPVQPDRPHRPDDPAQGRQEQRPDVQRPERQPGRRPDPPARPDPVRRPPEGRPSQPSSRPGSRDTWTPRPAPAQSDPRREQPRRAESSERGKSQAPRAAPRADPRRNGSSAPRAKGSSSKGATKGQPQLKRRHP
jgi:hypothetical protein